MRKKIHRPLAKLIGFAVVGLLSWSCAGSAQNPNTNEAASQESSTDSFSSTFGVTYKSLEAIETLTPKERRTIPQNAERAREEMTNFLIEKIQSEDNDVQCYAAYMLGINHLEDATAVLAGRITLEDRVSRSDDPFASESPTWWWGRFPAAEALVKIGNKSTSFVVYNLGENNGTNALVLSLWVIHSVNRNDKQATLRDLQKGLEITHDQKRKKSIQKAIDFFNSNDPARLLNKLER